jgi:hypothetical protein
MSLTELPTDPTATITTTGHSRILHGRPLLLLPYVAPVGACRGRKYRVEIAHGPACSRVVLSIGGQAAMRPPDRILLDDGEYLVLCLRALPPRTLQRVPADLDRALAAAGLDLDGFDVSRVRHLVSMVAEARDPVIRAARVGLAVEAARFMDGAGS